MIRYLTKWLSGLALCLMYSAALYGGTKEQSEDERLLKAAYIYNFAKFTRWPESVFKHRDSPLHLCTIGQNSLSTDLQHLEGKKIKGHMLTVTAIKKAREAKDCQALYIATNNSLNYRHILATIKNWPILTISEASYFARNGGVIQFYRKKGKTHLIINLNAAHKARLEISSRLLILAEIIGGKNS